MDGEDLRDWRQRHGLTQAALARELGTTASSVCHWELGQFPVPGFLELALTTLGMILNRRKDQASRLQADQAVEA